MKNVFYLGLAAGIAYIAYLAYNALQAPAAAVSSAYDATTTGIANAIVAATHNAVIPSGQVQMPNGANVAVSAFTNMGYDSNQILVFSYGGTLYAIAGATGNAGAYVATPYGSSTLQGLSGAFTSHRRRKRKGLR